MPDETNTADVTQPSEEAPIVEGMDAIREAIKAQLEPIQQQTQEPQPEPEPEPQQLAQEPEGKEPKEASEDDPAWKRSMLHRYDKLTAQKKDLEEQLQAEREKRYESKKAEETPQDTSIANLITKAETIQDLERLEGDAMEAERWAKRTLNRYRRDPEAVETEIERKAGTLPDDVEVWLEDLALNAEFSRESDIPKRKKQLIQQQQSFGIAASKYPWLNDPTSPAKAWVDGVKEEHPGIKAMPDVDLYLARALVGFAIEQEQASKAKPAKQTPQPTKQPGRPAATATVDDVAQRLTDVKKNAMKSGSKEGLKDFIKLHLEKK